ncbi:hypothetical protein [Arcobacter sp. FWKO B]|uniref:hypothetical protein n=1 Tax=Arcobacter sp. FWKO B TaxID=2593672 RepID=UPI0018A37683|nr:hypothetical protein [Arcobacter sp. FWKO B]QOG11935.1 hypothetical protein FWKOB_04120 [Arcobacter sp. FWKO B]
MNLKELIISNIKQNSKSRTFNLVYEGEKIWIKLPALGEANIWHKVLSLFYKITKNPLLAPTVVTNPKESLAYEASKLQKLTTLNINVPKVILADEEFLALSDCGTPLSLIINSEKYSFEEKATIMRKLSLSLANMHNLGIYHSRPALRDITYHNGEIYFMDFEENLEKVLDTQNAINRDVLIYIHSLYRKVSDQKLIYIALDTYKKNISSIIWTEISKEAQKYNILHFILKIIYTFSGKDARAIFQTLNYLRDIK